MIQAASQASLFDSVGAVAETPQPAAAVPAGRLAGPPVVAATDGSAIRNPGPAAWCWYVGPDCWAAGTFAHSTNNIAELTAVQELLRAVPRDVELEIRCDSAYTINAVTVWRFAWARKGWRTSSGSPVANADLIRSIAEHLTGRPAAVRFAKVRAHQSTGGDALNEAADVRANSAARAVLAGERALTGPGYAG